MITCFLSAQPPYRGLSGCPLLPTGCPQTPPMDQPFPDTSPLSPVTAEVTLMVLISPTDIHRLVYPSAYLLPPPPGAEGSTTFSPRLPQTSKWHHSASGGSGQKPRSQSRCFSSHHHPSAAPPGSNPVLSALPPTHIPIHPLPAHFSATSRLQAISVSRVDYCKKF